MNTKSKALHKFISNKKIYIVLITLIFIATGVFYSLTDMKYVASKKILVRTENTNLMDTYKELVTGSTLLEEVILNLNVNISTQELSNSIKTEIIKNTNMIEISVYQNNEELAKSILDEISKVFITTVDGIYGSTELYNVDTTTYYCTNKNTIIVGSCFGIIGFVLSIIFFVIYFKLDNKVKNCKDIEKITGLKSLISIPNIKSISRKKLNIKNMRAHKSDIFKVLMTNIQFLNINNLESKAIVVTSSKKQEGKTYVANNLAIEFAKAGKKVIIIDADLRNGRLANVYNLPNQFGFSNHLSNLDSNGNNINEMITRFINDTEIKNLNVITSGNIPPNPLDLIKTAKLKQLIKDLKVFYDIIIFDTVPVLDGPEVIRLSKVCDLTFLISTYKNTKKEELKLAYRKLSNIEGSVVGIGFNRVKDRRLKKTVDNAKNNFKKTGINIIDSIEKSQTRLNRRVHIIRKKVNNLEEKLKLKSEEVKDNIQSSKNKKEKIKLIEAGKIPEENIIKDVYESKIEIQEKNDEVKNNQDKVKKVKKEKDIKEKDPIKEKIEEEIKEEIKEENKQEIIKKELEKIKQERKKARDEQIKNYQEINLAEQEVITEEMVRRQVEMDELKRLAEKEKEEEKLQKKRVKIIKKAEKKKAQKEKRDEFMKKIKTILFRQKTEEEEYVPKFRPARKIIERQIQKEMQEDNLYPRPKM